MDNPVFQGIKSVFLYSAAWIIVGIIHAAVIILFYDQPVGLVVIDALTFNLLYALIGLAIWYSVRFSQPETTLTLSRLINHLTLVVVTSAIWLGLGYSLMLAFYPDQSYREFFVDSLAWRIISGLFFYFIIVLFYYLVIYYHNLRDKVETEAALKGTLKEAELNLLKTQINPHFLFNSLNSVSSLTITDPERAQEMIVMLSDFLRYTVSSTNDQFTPLEKELENIQRYLDIEKVRFGKILKYQIEADGQCMDVKIPTMLLQPLYENAVKHGVYESTDPIVINTQCELKDGFLEIHITNNFDPDARPAKGAGMGLKNIRDRLRLIYGSKQLLQITKSDNKFKATIIIPLKDDESRNKQ